MFRTQISLTEEDRRLLDVHSARTGRSMSALIREAVRSVYRAPAASEQDLAAIRAAGGAWSDRRDDGAAFVESLRSGDRLRDIGA